MTYSVLLESCPLQMKFSFQSVRGVNFLCAKRHGNYYSAKNRELHVRKVIKSRFPGIPSCNCRGSPRYRTFPFRADWNVNMLHHQRRTMCRFTADPKRKRTKETSDSCLEMAAGIEIECQWKEIQTAK